MCIFFCAEFKVRTKRKFTCSHVVLFCIYLTNYVFVQDLAGMKDNLRELETESVSQAAEKRSLNMF